MQNVARVVGHVRYVEPHVGDDAAVREFVPAAAPPQPGGRTVHRRTASHAVGI